MSYALPSDLKARYTKVDLLDSTVQTYLDEAYNYINSKLSSAYALPFQSAPMLVKYLEIDYAFAKIMMRPKDTETKTAGAEAMLERIDTDLESVVSGKMVLVDANGQIISKVNPIRSSATSAPIFSVEDKY
jgi:phage gp36-like protein